MFILKKTSYLCNIVNAFHTDEWRRCLKIVSFSHRTERLIAESNSEMIIETTCEFFLLWGKQRWYCVGNNMPTFVAHVVTPSYYFAKRSSYTNRCRCGKQPNVRVCKESYFYRDCMVMDRLWSINVSKAYWLEPFWIYLKWTPTPCSYQNIVLSSADDFGTELSAVCIK